MSNIVIRNVPDTVHAELARRAEVAGQSLQQYLTREFERITSVPTPEEVLAKIGRRRGGRVGLKRAVSDLSAGRARR